MAVENVYAAPEADIDAAPTAPILAQRSARLGAYLLDALLTAVFIAPYIYWVEPNIYVTIGAGIGLDVNAFAPTLKMLAIICLALGVLVAACNLWLLYREGQSIGKRILRIRIVRDDGTRAGFWRLVLLRGLIPGLLGAIPFLGWVWDFADPLFIFREDHRCLHDHIAHTKVVTA